MRFLAAFSLLLLVAEATNAVDSPTPDCYQLPNGLTVILRPIQGAQQTALVVLFNIGGDHDPKGKSGLAHMVEHVYVTAAAGKEKARNIQEYVARYPAGWNAQTGDRYTVVATVFPAKDLDKELQDAAWRMGDLRVTEDDLLREKPRIDDELANMFGRLPRLGAPNHARELVRPSPLGGRKGGVPDQVQALTVKEVQDRWQRYYKPRNAVLVLAGAVDPAAAKQAISTHFGPVATGDPPPKAEEAGKPQWGTVKEVPVKPLPGQEEAMASLGFAAPLPTDERYAALLALVARLQAAAMKLGGGPGRFPIQFMVLDDPHFLAINAPAKADETAQQAVARLQAFVAESIEPKLNDNEKARAKQSFGLFLGITDVPDAFVAQNPYVIAYALGRRHQLAIDSAKLLKAMDALSDQELRRAARDFLSPARSAGVLLRAAKERAAARMIYYTGQVQGVGFRATAADIARSYPVTGWVKNLADGRVQLMAEGPEDQVDSFLEAIRRKWKGSITKEQIEKPAATGQHKAFAVVAD
jgi:zinc protease